MRSGQLSRVCTLPLAGCVVVPIFVVSCIRVWYFEPGHSIQPLSSAFPQYHRDFSLSIVHCHPTRISRVLFFLANIPKCSTWRTYHNSALLVGLVRFFEYHADPIVLALSSLPAVSTP